MQRLGVRMLTGVDWRWSVILCGWVANWWSGESDLRSRLSRRHQMMDKPKQTVATNLSVVMPALRRNVPESALFVCHGSERTSGSDGLLVHFSIEGSVGMNL